MYPRISVVVPSLNQGQFLENALRSIVGQHYANLELIVIDGGSQDSSLDIIKKYSGDIDYWVSEPDGGQTNGLIKGFNRATGDIQTWLNADDMHEPHTLKTVADFFQHHPAARFVYGNCLWIDEYGRILQYRREMDFYKWLWLYAYNYIPQPAAFWKRTLYYQVGGLNADFLLSMDRDIFARFARICHMHHIDAPLARFRFHRIQRSRLFRKLCNKEEHAVLCREVGRQVGPVERFIVGKMARAIRYSYRHAFLRASLDGFVNGK